MLRSCSWRYGKSIRREFVPPGNIVVEDGEEQVERRRENNKKDQGNTCGYMRYVEGMEKVSILEDE